MTLKIRKLSYALGAEVIGIDFSKPIDNVTSSGIHSAFLDHCVLVFRWRYHVCKWLSCL